MKLKNYLLSLQAYPESVSTHLNYGNLLQEMERYKEAEEHYLFALDIDPKNMGCALKLWKSPARRWTAEKAFEEYFLN